MEPIEANYVPDGDDWTVTIVGRGKTLTATAPGLIAARDRADQMVDELAGDEKTRTVVHRLDGDALEFTTAYLNARLAKPPRVEVPAVDEKAPAPGAADVAAEKSHPGQTGAEKTASTKDGTAKKNSTSPAAPADSADADKTEKATGDEPAEAATGS
nr:hypothetical protein [Kibdelosporangium sp. MJ126-NF4]